MAVTHILAGPQQGGFIVSAKIAGASARLVLGLDPLLIGYGYASAATAPDANGWLKLPVSGLPAGQRYYYALEVDGVIDRTKVGTGVIIPKAGRAASFKILAASCMDGRTGGYPSIYSNSPIYPLLAQWHPDALVYVMTGDLYYADGVGGVRNQAFYRQQFENMFAQPNVQALLLSMWFLYQPDDHDYGAGNPTRLYEGIPGFQAAYRQCIPSPTLPSTSGLLYWTLPIGRLELLCWDLRGARDADTAAAPRAMLGTEQEAWFTGRLANTTAAGMVAISSSPIIGPAGTSDTWAGYHAEEIARLSPLIMSYRQRGAFGIINGDNHALSADDGTNNPLGGCVNWGFAALDGTGNYRGGPYSHGYTRGKNRYGAIEVPDDGKGITLKGTGYIADKPWLSLSTSFPAGYAPAGTSA